MVRLTDRLDITIVVDCDVKPQIKQNKKVNCGEKSGLRELTRNLAEFSPRKFAFGTFCSRSEREKRAFSCADLYM